jgi:uncharacterized protein YjgD (DUF1641 family)
MANPIPFKPALVDPRTELTRRLEAAPTEHAEALLVAWNILQTAHDEGVLDTVHGLIGAKDTIFAKLAEYAKLPEGVASIRNLLSIAKILGTLDPETLDQISKAMLTATSEHQQETKSPSLFQLARRANTEDSRRGLSFLTLILSSLGRALKD